MELEFKHIAAYSPYELNFYNNNHCEKMTKCYMEGQSLMIELDGHYKQCFTAACYFESLKNFKPIWKPVLRPLSDLHKEIEYQGKKIIPFVELAKIAGIRMNSEKYVNANEYRFDEPEYHTAEYLHLYGAKFDTGKPNSAAPNCQEFLIIYPPELRNEGTPYSFISDTHFQHRQHVHGGEFTHPVHHITKVIEKLQELQFDELADCLKRYYY